MAKVRLQYWTEVLEKGCRALSGWAGSSATPGLERVQHVLLELMTAAPSGPPRGRGLPPLRKVTREQRVQRGGASDDPAVVAAEGGPTGCSSTRGTPHPQQVAAPFAGQPRSIPVAGVAPHQAVGAAPRLPAVWLVPGLGCQLGWVAVLGLGLEAVHFFFARRTRPRW